MKQNIRDSTRLKIRHCIVNDGSYPWWLRSACYFEFLEDIAGIGFVGSTGSINDHGYYDYILFACII